METNTRLNLSQLVEVLSLSSFATAIYTTPDLIIEMATDAMISFWGKDRSVIGKNMEDAIPELKGQPFLEILRTVWHTGETYKARSTPAELMANGELDIYYYDFEYRAIKDSEGKTYCILHTAEDVTNRVKVVEAEDIAKKHRELFYNEQALNEELAVANEELIATNEELKLTKDSLHELNSELEERVVRRTKSLAESEANLKYILDDAPIAIAILKGPDFVVETANQLMLNIWGKNKGIINLPLLVAVPELEGQTFIPKLEQAFKTGLPYFGSEVKATILYDNELADIYVNFVYKPFLGDDNITQQIMVVATDVTEQVMSRKSVEALQNRLQAMVATTPVAMTILKGTDLVIENANESMYFIWQRGKDVIGQRLVDVFPELISQPFPKMLADVFETGKAISMPEIPVKIVVPDQDLEKDLHVNFSYDPLFDGEGNVESILATVIDVSELVAQRRMLEDSEENLQQISEELAASNEELQSINEEMVSSNEELKSANEQLVHTRDQLEGLVVRLKESGDRFRFLLNAIPQQVWTAKTDGALDYVNEVVVNDFGHSLAQVIGQGWQEFIHPEDLLGALKAWKRSLETGTEYVVEFRLRFNDGNYYWHLTRALPLIENNEIVLWLGTNTNIDLQKNNEQKKDEFLSIASHELKTPLTSIKAFNQIMGRHLADVNRLESYISKSAAHIGRLERLISDLLDVTKINAGKLEYNIHPFNFKAMLTDCIENVQQTTASHQLKLKNVVDIEYNGDHYRLEQVINNLLTNAVKYSPNGDEVLIDARVEEDSIVVSVQDFGIGIAKEHIRNLFDRYYRVDNTAMRFEGLGLGLFISSEITKRHNGSLWVESEVGKGATVYLKLPLN